MFFDVCVKCKQTFNDEAAFREHMENHKKNANAMRKTAAEEIADRITAETAALPGGITEQESAERLAKMREVNTKRKRLVNAGVEAQTMKPDEVEKRYGEEKARGNVR